jgi:hypothetical protein
LVRRGDAAGSVGEQRGEINPTFRVVLKLCNGLRIFPSQLMRLYERNMAGER